MGRGVATSSMGACSNLLHMLDCTPLFVYNGIKVSKEKIFNVHLQNARHL